LCEHACLKETRSPKLPGSCAQRRVQQPSSSPCESIVFQLPSNSSFLRTDNDEVRATVANNYCFRTRKLNRNRRPHVTAVWGGDICSTGDTRRGGLGNDVKQYLANLARAGSDRVSLFVLERINLPIRVQGKDHWFSVHFSKPPVTLWISFIRCGT
jgi:hypothetical protein